MEETGLPKRIVLGLRYFLPLLPLLAFAMAESTPRLWRGWLERRPPTRRTRLEAVATGALVVYVGGIGLAAAAVHPTFAFWSATQAEIRDALHGAVPDDAVVLTNWPATEKFLRALERKFIPLARSQTSLAELATAVERHGQGLGAWFRADREHNAEFLAAIDPRPELLVDRRVTPTDHLRVWRVREMRLNAETAKRPADRRSRH